ncbi:hypothetical protein K7640_10470 [Micromonospora sp. PLK6-60]|uniref:hypothetical protein n=1 Tax=Micromonospora sp. PLK6-60 TaxID=2873383 RepID=UPI001CA6A960|nr:hypothetical protein [Micromonospora sp. PLK6-60]MBY8872262.1 hypothetical protein [Micromonospora sp. PLK6-60]
MYLRLVLLAGLSLAAAPAPAVARSAVPVGDFSVSVAPGAAATVAGHPVSARVITATTSGPAQQVGLAITNLPAGVFAVFTPGTVTSGSSAVLSVRTSISARAGTYRLTVVAAGAAVRREATLLLTVTAAPVIRAAFYYPWFPQAWNQQGLDPYTNYRPTRGLYSVDETVVRQQVADMRYGGITLGIASWFGTGTDTDRHWPAIVRGAQDTGFAWAPYYEAEGRSDPSPDRIATDLHYLRASYGGDRSALAVLPGRGMVVFVYNAGDLTTAQGCGTVDRWNRARSLLRQRYGETIYLSLKVFPGYAGCPGTPAVDGWHQYGPARPEADFSRAPGAGSYTISPGFWKAGLPYTRAPFLSRDLVRWTAGITRMNASGARWQLVTTYNEWGEGTAVESSSGCRGPAPAGALCDWSGGGRSLFVQALHAQLPPGSAGAAARR